MTTASSEFASRTVAGFCAWYINSCRQQDVEEATSIAPVKGTVAVDFVRRRATCINIGQQDEEGVTGTAVAVDFVRRRATCINIGQQDEEGTGVAVDFSRRRATCINIGQQDEATFVPVRASIVRGFCMQLRRVAHR